MSLFTGLEQYGLDENITTNLFKEKEKNHQKNTSQMNIIQEKDFLFDKSYECPVCYKEFKERTLRTAKARLLKTDMDLRPVFEGIEPLKYDVIQCKECGFTALTRYFIPMTTNQRKDIVEKICSKYQNPIQIKQTYSFDEAIEKYRFALVNAIIKNAKASEKAYICLRGGWLCRSYIEYLAKEENVNQTKIKEISALEIEFLQNAYEGFIVAIQNESFPICGMDEPTVEYLLAALAIHIKKFDVASRFISKLLISPNLNNRIKDKVRDLKEEVILLQKKNT